MFIKLNKGIELCTYSFVVPRGPSLLLTLHRVGLDALSSSISIDRVQSLIHFGRGLERLWPAGTRLGFGGVVCLFWADGSICESKQGYV